MGHRMAWPGQVLRLGVPGAQVTQPPTPSPARLWRLGWHARALWLSLGGVHVRKAARQGCLRGCSRVGGFRVQWEKALWAERGAVEKRPHSSLDQPFGGPGPPGTTVPAKKTEFSLRTPLPPPPRPVLASSTHSRPNILPPAAAQLFPGRGAFCHVRSCHRPGSSARPSPLARLGRPVASGRTLSGPRVPSSVSGSGVQK